LCLEGPAGANRLRITDDSLVHIAKMKSLETLLLPKQENPRQPHITEEGLAHLSALPHLKHLRAGKVGFVYSDDLLKGMSSLQSLEELYILRQDSITDAGWASVAKLKSLRWLNASPCQFTDQSLAHLAKMASLQRLHIGPNITDRGLAHLASLKDVWDLAFGGEITDRAVDQLVQLPRLRELWIYDQVLTDKHLARLARLKSLTTLRLGACPVSALKQLKTLPNLTTLEVSVRSDGPALDLSGLLKLERLRIGTVEQANSGSKEPPLTDRDLSALAGLRHLRALFIKGEFTDEGIAPLVRLPDLERLEISGSGISDRTLIALSKCGKLEYLNIKGSLMDRGLLALSNCRTLTQLYIDSDKPLSDEAVARFQDQKNIPVIRPRRVVR
jgi:hypothetical protein